jgi:hypothetical protein
MRTDSFIISALDRPEQTPRCKSSTDDPVESVELVELVELVIKKLDRRARRV